MRRRSSRLACRWRLALFLVVGAAAWLRVVLLGLGVAKTPALTPESQDAAMPTTQEPTQPANEPRAPQRAVAKALSAQSDAVHFAEMQMDPLNRWVPIPPERLAWLERDGTTPLARECDNATTVIAFHNAKYGGFTADMGWALMVSMYSAETAGTCPEFSDAWGHGCDAGQKPASWACFFRPIGRGQGGGAGVVKKLDSGSQPTRRAVRRDALYGRERGSRHRYPRLAALAGPCLDAMADLLAWRLVFRWTFRVNDNVRAKIDAIRARIKLPARYAGAHIRLGDKVGLRPGPREASPGTYEVNDYAVKLRLHYGARMPEALFVASDDYNAAVLLGELLGVAVVTSAEPQRDKGFSITEYRTVWTDQQKFDAAVRLWADMEILAGADAFLGTFQSNVDRTVHLMRFDKAANTTLAVDRFGHSRCSARARDVQITSHNFWLCA